MEIKWHGATCFTLKGKGVKAIINPLDKTAKADIALISNGGDEALKNVEKVVNWPGEYEIKGVSIVGMPAWTKSKGKEEEEGGTGDKTIMFYANIEGIKVCHLGELGHDLTSEIEKEIGDIDVLLINLGEKGNLSAKKAMEVIEAIDPRIIIPMGEGKFDEKMKEAGLEGETQEIFSVKSRSELPDDKRVTMILKSCEE